jgi:hypothetical protein
METGQEAFQLTLNKDLLLYNGESLPAKSFKVQA